MNFITEYKESGAEGRVLVIFCDQEMRGGESAECHRIQGECVLSLQDEILQRGDKKNAEGECEI